MDEWIMPIVSTIIGGIFTLIVFVLRRFAGRKRIQVSSSYMYPIGLRTRPISHITVKVVNVGKPDVIIDSIFLSLKSGHTLIPMNNTDLQDSPLPARLSSQSSSIASFYCYAVLESLRERGLTGKVLLTPACRDSTDRVFIGKKINLEVQ